MDEQNKYYTPKIEEFHIGFECEFKNNMQSNKWEKEICDQDTISIVFNSWEHEDLDEKFEDEFRVKYLDQEDIESLGWEFIESNLDFKKFSFSTGDELKNTIENAWKLRLEKEPYRVFITQGHGWTRFLGTIKNKSELKRLLKQLNIL